MACVLLIIFVRCIPIAIINDNCTFSFSFIDHTTHRMFEWTLTIAFDSIIIIWFELFVYSKISFKCTQIGHESYFRFDCRSFVYHISQLRLLTFAYLHHIVLLPSVDVILKQHTLPVTSHRSK